MSCTGTDTGSKIIEDTFIQVKLEIELFDANPVSFLRLVTNAKRKYIKSSERAVIFNKSFDWFQCFFFFSSLCMKYIQK